MLARLTTIAGVTVMAVALQFSCTRSGGSEDGAAIFASSCARCHGSDGAGGAAVSTGGVQPRNFREGDFHAQRTDEQIKQTIINGKGTAMPSFGVMFTDVQLRALVTHVRSFGPKMTPAVGDAVAPSATK